MMTRKEIVGIDVALRIYYEHPEIGNKEIDELFGKCSSSTRVRMKNAVLEEMANQGVPQWHGNRVNTRIAYEVWGIDVKDLEYRRKKLKQLGLLPREEDVS